MSLKEKIITVIGGAVSGGEVLTKSNPELTPSISIVQQKEHGSKLMNDLIKKEVTEEVKQLRYRTYWVEEESYKYNVKLTSEGTNVTQKSFADFTKPNVFEEENKKVMLVQNTEPISSGADNDVQVQKEGIKFKQYYPLNIDYGDFFSKFKIEKYCKQVVLKRFDETFQLDMYFNLLPSTDDRIERNLTFEIEKVFNNESKISNLIDFDTIEFTTKNAWGNKNNIRHIFKNIKNNGVSKFSSFYVLHYIVELVEMEDMIEQYYNENIAKEYENKTKRPNMNIPVNLFTGIPEGANDVLKCDKCGKEMKDLERADYYITKYELGNRGVCLECFKTLVSEGMFVDIENSINGLKNKFLIDNVNTTVLDKLNNLK
jgi:hypothetical protein